MIEQSHRWQRTAAAAAVFALLGLAASEVAALSLGRITVQSALGEPLRAEIEVPSISAEEANSLKANAASPAAFVAAGLDYNPAMAGLQATLARRADGRAFIRLSSERSINEPFVDMILEASWSAGRIVRDYTMLFDPPSLKQASAPTLAQTTVATPAPMTARVVPAPEDVAPAASKPAVAAPTPPAALAPAAATPPAATAAIAATAPTPKAQATDARKVTVKAGDTATQIALREKTNDVSLDQMLVALLRANPDAFGKGNLNRLRAGQVLDLPSLEQAQSISNLEAHQTVVAQSKDFNEFRRSLASNAPKINVEATNRKASGSVEAKVEDKKPGSSAADKLTLSKGVLQAKANEAKIAKERADKDAADRAAELAKNIADLNKLSVVSSQKSAAAAAAAASQPASSPMAIAMASVVAPAASAPAAEASTPVADASAPVAAPETSSPVLAAAPATAASAAAKPMHAQAEQDMLDQLLEDPTLPLAGGGLIALIGGYIFYRRQQSKKRAAHVDSSFLDSRLQPDSFFGASGGQRVDTAQDADTANSSLSSYSNSQLGSADDVDPVAEADVYLAYGRDAQAEDILLEALLHNPGRLAIHSKLLDMYAKRGDASSFLSTANNAFQLVGADTPEWARICALGLTIDPHNPLYQPGGASASTFASLEPAVTETGNDTLPIAATQEAIGTGSDLDLDLDFSADEAPTSGSPLSAHQAEETTKIAEQYEEPSNGLDFDISAPAGLDYTPSEQTASEPLPPAMQELAQSMDGLSLGKLDMDEPAELTLELPEFETTGHQSPESVTPKAYDEGMLEFDLDSLDLGPGINPEVEVGDFGSDEGSLETKLALAEEFVSIGDQDGARALIEEVVAEATGELREKAQRALAKLS